MSKAKIPAPATSLVQQLTAKHVKPPHVSELCEALINEFGGASGFAKEWKLIYGDASKPHKIVMMRAMSRLIEVNTQLGGATEDISVMTEDDLKRLLKELVPNLDRK